MAFPIDVYPADEVKLIEKAYASEHNSDCYDLMLKAGKSVYEAIAEYAPSAKDVWIFCGKGNNGGDGYVLAKGELEFGLQARRLNFGKESGVVGINGNVSNVNLDLSKTHSISGYLGYNFFF